MAAEAVAAHHSFAAEFDLNRPVTLTGNVTKIEWTNPHAWIFIEVKDDEGSIEAWAIEVVGANNLMRRGWTRDTLKFGDVITVEGFGARDGSNTGNASAVIMASTGTRLYASSAAD
jgi:DNA/RNA endonuclease YhcR with UshA esterase domain